jgi:D-glycero-D-manno-heptose 1,7-bisphosphate phosphatase
MTYHTTFSYSAFVLLDRDGTIIHERNYLGDPDKVELLPNAARGLRRMREAGFGLLVLTNQSGIGRGYFSEADMHAVHDRLQDLLRAEGVQLDGFLFCPHRPDQACGCRKPRPGLGEQAAARFGMVPEHSFMVGDKACDIALGKALGTGTILVRTGYGAQEESDTTCRPDAVVDDLVQAADHIVSENVR